MTILQLEQANEINRKILILRHIKFELNTSYIWIVFGKEKEIEMSLMDFSDLRDFISGYISDKIVELEKRLEEL